MKKPNLIYPCGFEIFKHRKQEKEIDNVMKDGYIPIFIFNDDSNNIKNLIPTKFKKNIEKHPAYRIWIDMLMKCYDTEHPQYKNEGAQGIEVCSSWINSFTQFCKDMKITNDMA